MIYLTTALLAFFIFSGICKAEPDSTIKYLMNEPVSMLDWGLFQLEKRLEAGLSDVCSVDYEPVSNRIRIERIIGFDKKLPDIEWAKSECKSAVIGIRVIADQTVAFKSDFYHRLGSSRFKREPENLAEMLMKVTEIRIVVFYRGTTKPIRCMGPLLGEDIYFKE